MSTSLITLDARGIVEDPDQKIERVLAYMLATEASQSNVHRDQLTSIPDIIRRHGSDMVSLKTAMENALENSLRGYFDNVLVDLDTRLSESEPGKILMTIRAKVEQSGKWHDVAKALTSTNDTIKLITEFDVV